MKHQIGNARYWFTQALASILSLKRKRPVPDWRLGQPKVLFLRYDRIGDMIVTTGIFKALKEAYPNIQLDVLASPSNASILQNEPHIHQVWTRKPKAFFKLIRCLRRQRYDVVIDYHVYESSRTTMLIMLLCGAKHRLGMGGKATDRIYSLLAPDHLDGVHLIRNLANLLAPFGLDPTANYRPTLQLTELELAGAKAYWQSQPKTQHCLINVSKAGKYGNWPAARYIELIQYIKSHYPQFNLCVMGVKDQEAFLLEIAECSQTAYVFPNTIRDAIALVATADFVITPDTSIAHAMSAFQKPGVVFYTQRESTTWGVYDGVAVCVEGPSDYFADLPLATVIAALKTAQLPSQAA